jgi:hypothetical protein
MGGLSTLSGPTDRSVLAKSPKNTAAERPRLQESGSPSSATFSKFAGREERVVFLCMVNVY